MKLADFGAEPLCGHPRVARQNRTWAIATVKRRGGQNHEDFHQDAGRANRESNTSCYLFAG